MEPSKNLDPQQSLPYSKGKSNNFGDEIWFITDSITGKKNIIHWDWPCAQHRIHWAQSFCLIYCEGYTDKQQTLCARASTVKGVVTALKRWMRFSEMHYPDTPLCAWTLKHLIKLLQFAVTDIDIDKTNNELLGRATNDTLISLLQKSFSFYHLGRLADGISCHVPANLIELGLKDFVEARGVNFNQWRKGGSYSAVPLHIASLLLADAIQTLRDPQTTLLLAYFDHQRTEQRLTYSALFSKNTYNRVIQKKITGSIYFNTPVKAIKLLAESLNNAAELTLTEFPWSRHEALSEQCKQIYDAVTVIFLCLTGIRISELASIEASWFKPRRDGAWDFKSEVPKTNHGLSTVRSLAGLAAEAADVVNRLSYLNKNKPGCKLMAQSFTATILQKQFNPETMQTSCAHEQTLRYRLKQHYEAFIVRHGEEIRDAHPNIHPHQFRHSFAEFALRRFDGNILEAIRHHYRHAAGSYMTRNYTNDKLAEEAHTQLERDYIAELIQRMNGDEAPQFTGPIALHIKGRIKETHNIGNAEEIEAAMEAIADEIEHIIAHEWGFCMLRKDSRSKASCMDRKTGLPDIQERSSFENCSSCIHRLTHRSQKEDIYRIGLSHQNFIDNYPLPRVTQNSKTIVKRCNVMLNEMEDV